MPRTRPPYPEEFKREAIKLVRISSKSQHQIAEDLGISDVTLRNWVKQAERDEGLTRAYNALRLDRRRRFRCPRTDLSRERPRRPTGVRSGRQNAVKGRTAIPGLSER